MIDTTICKYFSEIVNYEYHNSDIFSYKLIEWYKEVVFLNIKEDLIINIDEAIYLFISDKRFNKELRKEISIKQININNLNLINIIIDIRNNYLNNYKLEVSRWL